MVATRVAWVGIDNKGKGSGVRQSHQPNANRTHWIKVMIGVMMPYEIVIPTKEEARKNE